jgi:hypothetical protein
MESSHHKIQGKGNPSKTIAKLYETMAKNKTINFHSGVDKVMRFLEDDG